MLPYQPACAAAAASAAAHLAPGHAPDRLESVQLPSLALPLQIPDAPRRSSPAAPAPHFAPQLAQKASGTGVFLPLIGRENHQRHPHPNHRPAPVRSGSCSSVSQPPGSSSCSSVSQPPGSSSYLSYGSYGGSAAFAQQRAAFITGRRVSASPGSSSDGSGSAAADGGFCYCAAELSSCSSPAQGGVWGGPAGLTRQSAEPPGGCCFLGTPGGGGGGCPGASGAAGGQSPAAGGWVLSCPQTHAAASHQGLQHHHHQYQQLHQHHHNHQQQQPINLTPHTIGTSTATSTTTAAITEVENALLQLQVLRLRNLNEQLLRALAAGGGSGAAAPGGAPAVLHVFPAASAGAGAAGGGGYQIAAAAPGLLHASSARVALAPAPQLVRHHPAFEDHPLLVHTQHCFPPGGLQSHFINVAPNS
jgi:hypothetical protein